MKCRLIVGNVRQCSEIDVQEFDRVIVERRCHVIYRNRQSQCLPFLRGDYKRDSGFLDRLRLYIYSIIKQKQFSSSSSV